MPATKYSPALAFAFLLSLLIAGGLVLQSIGHVLSISFARRSFPLLLLPALWLTYARCFPADRRHIIQGLMLALALAALGLASRHWYDFTPDGMGYQQPSAEALLMGWNPLGPEPDLLWQQIYPSGAWGIEASLAGLYGSMEASKMLAIWLVFITLPVLLSGLSCYCKNFGGPQRLLAVLCVLSATVMAQLLTHYVDALIYLSGMTLIGAALMHGRHARGNLVPLALMAGSVLFIVNAKFSGIYHAAALCAGAVVFLWNDTRRFPWKPAVVLFLAGTIAVFFIGYRPYVTNFIQYGLTMFPDNPDAFIGAQRPSNFDGIPGFERFFYSLFSITGGAPHVPAELKWPWTIHAGEWKFSGDPDARTGGFGPLFALGFIASIALFASARVRKVPVDKGMVILSAACLLSSALFPQSWWARYVPFGYAAPFLLLLSIPCEDKAIRSGIYTLIALFAVNSGMAGSAAFALYSNNQSHFIEVSALLRKQPAGSVYLVPPVANYRKYNDAYMPLMRRLKEQGVESSLKVDAPCPRQAEIYSEYKLCY